MSNLTGPEAPRYFRVCLRGQLGYPGPHGDLAPEIHACNMVEHRGYLPTAEDVVMLVKDRMASTKVSQIVLMVPKAARPTLWSIDVQPIGSHARRPGNPILIARRYGMMPCDPCRREPSRLKPVII